MLERQLRLVLTGLSIPDLPDNQEPLKEDDACAEAVAVMEGAYNGTTVGATNDGSASCGNSATSPDAWYRFTAPQDGVLNVETCVAGYDTVLSIHSACPGTIDNQLACNDDSCGVRSSLSADVMGGQTYLIRVAGYNGATGGFLLNVDLAEPLEPRR